MKIKAVAFDYGGVICYAPSPENHAEVERLCGLSAHTLRELNRKFRGEWDRGLYSGADYYRHILSAEGIFPDDETLLKIAQTDMDGWKRLNPATVQLMRDIRDSGLSLGILSNMPHDFLAWARQNIPVFGETDAAVFSCDHNLLKPETAIYGKLKDGLGFEYGEIVFFDDTPDNIAKARELGIQGFVWEGAEAARESLKCSGMGFEAV
jgi:putative hydrolase of the HAD superfamily